MYPGESVYLESQCGEKRESNLALYIYMRTGPRPGGAAKLEGKSQCNQLVRASLRRLQISKQCSWKLLQQVNSSLKPRDRHAERLLPSHPGSYLKVDFLKSFV